MILESFDIPIQFPIQFTLHVTKQDVDDIMAAALDQIGYWCDNVVVPDNVYLGSYASDQVARGGYLKLYYEDESDVLDIFKLIDGMKKFYSEGYDIYHSLQPDCTINTCNIDGEMADTIVQLALFGEVVYG